MEQKKMVIDDPPLQYEEQQIESFMLKNWQYVSIYYYNIVTLLLCLRFCIKLNIILAYTMDSINNSLPTNCSDLIRQQ